MSFSYSTLRPLPYTTLFRPARSAGRNCGGRIYSRPSSLWKPYFAPRMRVCLSHEKEMSQIVMLTAQISDDHPRRNRSEEQKYELQSLRHVVCSILLEIKKYK